MNWQNQNKLALINAYHHDLNLVLCREDGNFMPKSSLFNAFSRILKRAGLPPLPIHSLRHTHAVILLESGADMKYVQEATRSWKYPNYIGRIRPTSQKNLKRIISEI
ncbi:tyrosine-type recombinase/integrase [Paenibacillus apiarius]|uniref:tyrosine-type recombinase/integrase n=1 Tax=Paenibacillus apiarius TaxID=46240 RepID=UPI003AB94A79